MSALASMLGNRAWLRRSSPFPHIVARDVFTPAVYAMLARDLQSVLDRGVSETPDLTRFSRNISNYDSYGIGFRPTDDSALSLFVSPAWRDLLAGCFGLTRTPYVFAGSHYHAPDSANGFVHNDFNPVWFPRANTEQIQVPNHAICTYKTGAGTLDSDAKIQVVRGAVAIFFLLNDGWRPGDGGETGLYRSADELPTQPAQRIPPRNNTLVAFECRPDSFHTFISNVRAPRTSIIMWAHRPLEEATQRFGAERLEHWK